VNIRGRIPAHAHDRVLDDDRRISVDGVQAQDVHGKEARFIIVAIIAPGPSALG